MQDGAGLLSDPVINRIARAYPAGTMLPVRGRGVRGAPLAVHPVHQQDAEHAFRGEVMVRLPDDWVSSSQAFARAFLVDYVPVKDGSIAGRPNARVIQTFDTRTPEQKAAAARAGAGLYATQATEEIERSLA